MSGNKIRAKTPKKAIRKVDSFKNVLKGLNVKGTDGNTQTYYEEDIRLADATVISLTTRQGIGKRTIDLLAGDMTREWFEVKQDPEGLILDYLKKLKTRTMVRKALRWGLGIGGGAIFVGINDNEEPEKAVNKDNIKSINFLKVFDRTNMWPHSNYVTDDSRNGKVEVWRIQSSGMTQPQYIHETRLLIFDGEDVTDDQRVDNLGWGDSFFQAIYPALEDLTTTYDYVLRAIQEFRKSILKMDGVFDLVTADQEEELTARLNLLDATSSFLNREVIDKNTEEFEYKSASLAGLSDLVYKKELQYSLEVGIPLTFLFGQTPQGLNATNKGEERIYYDKISVKQTDMILSPIEKLVEYVMLAKEGPTNGVILEGWDIEFNSLWQQTTDELIKTRRDQAEIDKINVENLGMDPKIIVANRYGGNDYSFETKLDVEIPKNLIEFEEAKMARAQEIQNQQVAVSEEDGEDG